MIPVLEQLLDRGELARAGFTSFLALTYGVDLPWFEHHLGQQLRVAGVRRFLIFADGPTLDETLPPDLADAPGAGSWYAVEAVRAAGAFHPKAYLLAGPRGARLYVGSGNLTQPGLGRNLELFERWDATLDSSGLPEPVAAFGRLVYGMVRDRKVTAPHIRELLDAIFGEPVFTQPVRASPSVVLGTPGEVLPALDAPTSARTLALTAPYFDADGEQVVELARRLQAASFSVVVDVGMTNLTPAGREAIERAGGHILALDEDRRCHAKALFAEGDAWRVAVHGSANVSRAAWTGHNVELVVLRRGDAAAEVRDALAERKTRELEPEEWAALQPAPAPGEGEPCIHANLAIASARWTGVATIELAPAATPPSTARIRLRDADEERVLEPGPLEGGRFRVSAPLEVERRIACAVRLEAEEDVGGWVVVHDPDELRFQGRARSSLDSRAEAYLCGSRGDGDLTQEFLEFLIAMDEEQTAALDRGGHGRTSAPVPSKPDWAWVKEEDFAAEADFREPNAPKDAATSDPENVGAARLLHRLLFGHRTRTSEAEDGTAPALAGSDAAAEAEEEARSGGAAGAKAAEKTTPAERDLHDVVARATTAFINRVRRAEGTESPERLLRALLVLVAAIQDAARAGHVSDRALGEHLVRLVGEVLGRSDAPLPRALAAIPIEERSDAWARTPFLIGACLALYNACVVTAVVHDDSPDSATFPGYRAVLWARHVLRHAPSLDSAALGRDVAARVPALRRFGVLWLADRWGFESLVSFEEFVAELVRDATEIEAAELALSSVRSRIGTRLAMGDDDAVVGFGRDGRIAPGFAEDGGLRVLFDGAFQAPDAHDVLRRAYQSSKTPVVSFDGAVTLVPELPEDARRGLALLKSMV